MVKRGIYECVEDIANAFYCELVASEVSDDILNILEDDLVMDLERVLAKIKMYSEKVNK